MSQNYQNDYIYKTKIDYKPSYYLPLIINLMTDQQDNFFATQIHQKQEQRLQVESPQQQNQQEIKQENNEESNTTQMNTDQRNLKTLLAEFNSYDKLQRGVITLQECELIIKSHNISSNQIKQYHGLSLPIQPDKCTFDQFLFVFCLCQYSQKTIDDKYQLCKKVDRRLIEFLKLLNNYRKKCERQTNYQQAKKSKQKVIQIRQKELQRRKNYLDMLHNKQMAELQQKQQQKFINFCSTWDRFMNQYEATAIQLAQKLKERQFNQMQQFSEKNKLQLSQKMHYSKQFIELQTLQKNYVKVQDYEKADKIKKQLEYLKYIEESKKQAEDEDIIEMRCETLRKQQKAAINTLMQKIQKDRNDQLKQRQTDSQKLIIKNKSLISQLKHRHQQSIKKIWESLHNLNLDDKSKKGSNKNIKQ